MTTDLHPTDLASAPEAAATAPQLQARSRRPEFIVEHFDGRKETVPLRLVRPTEFEKWPSPVGEELTFVARVCDRPMSWLDELAPESLNELVTEALRVNSSFTGWWNRRLSYLASVPSAVASQAARAGRGPRED
jgi:hypothetical protein